MNSDIRKLTRRELIKSASLTGGLGLGLFAFHREGIAILRRQEQLLESKPKSKTVIGMKFTPMDTG